MRRASSRSDACGIITRYKDAFGKWRQTPEETYDALLEVIGQPEAHEEAPSPRAMVRPELGSRSAPG